MTTRPRQSGQFGFTLIEALISVFIMSLVIAAALFATSTLVGREAAAAEGAELDERKAIIIDTLQPDIDAAGRKLTETDSYDTGVQPGLFLPDANYSTMASATYGSATKIGPSGWTDTLDFTRDVPAGRAYALASLVAGSELALETLDHTQSRAVVIDSTGSVRIQENGVTVQTLSSFVSGDSYRIAQEPSQSGGWAVDYYRTTAGAEALAYTSIQSALPYPISASLAIYGTGSTVQQVQIFGDSLGFRAPQTTLPPLPFDSSNGKRLTGPVTVTTSAGVGATSGTFVQAVVLASDPSVDTAYTSTAYTPGVSTLTIQVTTPRRGSYSPGDYILLIDPRPVSRACAMFRVTAAMPGVSLTALTVIGVTGQTPSTEAWTRFYSGPSDFSYTFPTGSYCVRILPLATYVVQQGLLVRQIGYHDQSGDAEAQLTVAPGIQSFSIQPQQIGTATAYNCAVTAQTEGYQTGLTVEPMSFTLAPRAVTKPPEWQAQIQ